MSHRKYLLALLFAFLPFNFALAKTETINQRLKGRIVLQVQQDGQAWYVDPIKGEKRVALLNSNNAFNVFLASGVAITNKDLAKIKPNLDFLSGIDSDGDGLPDAFEKSFGTNPNKVDTDSDTFNDKTEIQNGYNPVGSGKLSYDKKITDKYKGYVLIQKESCDEAWYVDPVSGTRFFLNSANTVTQVIKKLGLGVSNSDLNLITEVKVQPAKVSVGSCKEQDLDNIQIDLNNFAESINKQDVNLFLASVGSSFKDIVYSKENPAKTEKTLSDYKKSLKEKKISYKVIADSSELKDSNYYVKVHVYLDGEEIVAQGGKGTTFVFAKENNLWKLID